MLIVGIIYLLVIASYMFSYYRYGNRRVFIMKMITSACFLGIAISAVISNMQAKNYALFIIIALSCGMVGDCLLGLRSVFPHKKKQYFILGITMFLIGHLVYLYLFLSSFNGKVSQIVFLSIILGFITIGILEACRLDFGRLRPINYLYLLICCLLFSVAFIKWLNDITIISSIVFAGVLLFVASDLSLCFIYFKKVPVKKYKLLKYFNIIAYYLGQGLLALSILFA